MAFPPRRWPRSPRTVQTSFRAIRRIGPTLWPDPAPTCESLPALPPELARLGELIECHVKNAMLRALGEGPPVFMQPAPQYAPPFRHRTLNRSGFLLVGSDSLTTLTAVIDMHFALSGAAPSLVSVNDVYPASASDMEEWLSISAGQFERLHIDGLKLDASSLDAYAFLAFTVQVNGETILDRVGIESLEKFSCDVPTNGTVRFLVSNLDPLSAFLIPFTVYGWGYTSGAQGNDLSGSLLRQDASWQMPREACVPSLRQLRTGGCS